MEDFVTFEIAKKLKEEGFPQNMCDDGYITEEYDAYHIGDRSEIFVIPDCLPYIAVPTIAQALKWLREKKGLHIELWITGERPIKWHHTIHTLNYSRERKGWSSGEVCDSYEQAALSAIEYVLDNLI